MDTIRNLTGHDVVVTKDDDTEIVLKGNKYEIARLTSTKEPEVVDVLPNGIQVIEPHQYDDIDGLPAFRNTNILVSEMLASYLVENGWDGAIYAPDTSPQSAVRNKEGAITSVSRLIRYKPNTHVSKPLTLPNLSFKDPFPLS